MLNHGLTGDIGFPGRRVDPKRAGITAMKLINDQSARQSSKCVLHRQASPEYLRESGKQDHRLGKFLVTLTDFNLFTQGRP